MAALLLTTVAAIPRFYDLGRLGLWGDEDLTFLAARSVADGEGPMLPSGMPYLRALPFTWANAAAASVLGEDQERSYRVTAAAFGTATPAAVFLTGAEFVSPPAALVAATMLALSEWHIGFSRYARMYAPFVFFFVITAFFMWRWAWEGGRWNLVLAITLFGVTVWLQLLGLIAVEFALIPLALRAKGSGPKPALVIAVALGAAAIGYALSDLIVSAPYRAWSLPVGYQLPGVGTRGAGASPTGNPLIWLASLGALVGLWLGWKATARKDGGKEEATAADLPPLRRLAIITAWTSLAAFLGAGHLWGATQAGAVLLLLNPEPVWAFARRHWRAALFLLFVALAWAAYAILSLGLGDGIRRLALFPFPYLALLWEQFPGIVALFVVATLWLISSSRIRAERPGLTGVLLAAILPIAAIGMMRDWASTRYLFEIYPFILLGAAALLVTVADRVAALFSPAHASSIGAVVAVLVVLSGATGGHGLAAATRAATLGHGDPVFDDEFRPDHRGPGEYVRRNLTQGDVVIAENPETQVVYAGKVDYWLRRPGDARSYLYLDDQGSPREHFAGSILLPDVESIRKTIRMAKGRVWLITSGETAPQRDYYLSEDQRLWLDSLEADRQPEFVGEDGVSSVYCLNCQQP